MIEKDSRDSNIRTCTGVESGKISSFTSSSCSSSSTALRIWIALFFFSIVKLAEAKGACPRQCSCTGSQWPDAEPFVECDVVEDLPFPTGFPPDTVHLKITSSAFSSSPSSSSSSSSSPFQLVPSFAFTNLPSLRHLTLQGLNLDSLPRVALQPLVNLRELVLRGNRLKRLSAYDLAWGYNLVEAHLADNGLQSVDNYTFRYTPNLQVLDLSDNNLTSVPPNLPRSLRRLHLRANPVRSIGHADLAFNSDLRVFDCRDCALESLHPFAFMFLSSLEEAVLGGVLESVPGEILGKMPTLEKVDVTLQNFPLKAITSSDLAGLESLTSLTLESVSTATEVSARALSRLRRLKRLVIVDSAHLAQRILLSPQILDSLQRLEKLEMRDNILDAIGKIRIDTRSWQHPAALQIVEHMGPRAIKCSCVRCVLEEEGFVLQEDLGILDCDWPAELAAGVEIDGEPEEDQGEEGKPPSTTMTTTTTTTTRKLEAQGSTKEEKMTPIFVEVEMNEDLAKELIDSDSLFEIPDFEAWKRKAEAAEEERSAEAALQRRPVAEAEEEGTLDESRGRKEKSKETEESTSSVASEENSNDSTASATPTKASIAKATVTARLSSVSENSTTKTPKKNISLTTKEATTTTTTDIPVEDGDIFIEDDDDDDDDEDEDEDEEDDDNDDDDEYVDKDVEDEETDPRATGSDEIFEGSGQLQKSETTSIASTTNSAATLMKSNPTKGTNEIDDFFARENLSTKTTTTTTTTSETSTVATTTPRTSTTTSTTSSITTTYPSIPSAEVDDLTSRWTSKHSIFDATTPLTNSAADATFDDTDADAHVGADADETPTISNEALSSFPSEDFVATSPSEDQSDSRWTFNRSNSPSPRPFDQTSHSSPNFSSHIPTAPSTARHSSNTPPSPFNPPTSHPSPPSSSVSRPVQPLVTKAAVDDPRLRSPTTSSTVAVRTYQRHTPKSLEESTTTRTKTTTTTTTNDEDFKVKERRPSNASSADTSAFPSDDNDLSVLEDDDDFWSGLVSSQSLVFVVIVVVGLVIVVVIVAILVVFYRRCVRFRHSRRTSDEDLRFDHPYATPKLHHPHPLQRRPSLTSGHSGGVGGGAKQQRYYMDAAPSHLYALQAKYDIQSDKFYSDATLPLPSRDRRVTPSPLPLTPPPPPPRHHDARPPPHPPPPTAPIIGGSPVIAVSEHEQVYSTIERRDNYTFLTTEL